MLYYVLRNVKFPPSKLCGVVSPDCNGADNPLLGNWTVQIPGNKPPVQPWPIPQPHAPKLRVLHLTDIHIDRNYSIGSEANCTSLANMFGQLKLCCRRYPTDMPPYSQPAGQWGTVAHCDIPWPTFVNAMQHIAATEPNLDYIIITGDFESHDPYNYNRAFTLWNVANITQTIYQYFPNVPVYQATGNHEGVPTDAFASHAMPSLDYATYGPQWLYTVFNDQWARYLTPAQSPTIQYRGSYAFSPYRGLKIISLNTIYCSMYNYYTYLLTSDPDGTLTWMVQQLLASEAAGEKVHIIGHIPSGRNYCQKAWAKNYYDIVNRFESTIAAQMFGHSHSDFFEVFYADSNPNGRASHFTFCAPSLTTDIGNQPAYRIYTIDGNYPGSSFTVLDAETYSTNVTLASMTGNPPVWSRLYSARTAYNMPDLSPHSWNDLINRLSTDNNLLQTYAFNYKRGTTMLPCGSDCRSTLLCDLKTAKSFEQANFCAGLLQET